MKPIRYWDSSTPPSISTVLTIAVLILAIFWQPVSQVQHQLLQAAPLPGLVMWPLEVIVFFLAVNWLLQTPRLLREADETANDRKSFWLDNSLTFGFQEIHINNQQVYAYADSEIPYYIVGGLETFGITFSVTEITFEPSRARRNLEVVQVGKFVYFYLKTTDAQIAHLWENKLYIEKAANIVVPPKQEEQPWTI